MKKFLLYLYMVCALISLVIFIYQALPVFPYINETGVVIPGLAFVVFYFLAYRAGQSRKSSELA
jgi:hypothetical protein